MNSYARALCLLFVLAVPAACAAPSAPGLSAFSARVRPAQAASGSALAYVADAGSNAVYIYPAGQNNPKRIGAITGLDNPFGLALDSGGNLFVANSNADDIPVYQAGTEKLLRTLSFPSSFGPVTLAFDPQGVLFAVNGSGLVAEYPPGSSSPSKTFSMTQTTRITSMGEIAFDSAGNLYAAVVPVLEKPAHVFKFAPGATQGGDLYLDIQNNSTEPGLAIDALGNLYVGNYADVDVFAPGNRIPTAHIGVSRTFTHLVGFLATGSAGDFYLTRRGTNGYVVEYGPGRSRIGTIGGLLNPLAVTVSAK